MSLKGQTLKNEKTWWVKSSGQRIVNAECREYRASNSEVQKPSGAGVLSRGGKQGRKELLAEVAE